MKNSTRYTFLLVIALLFGAPLAMAGSTSCAQKKNHNEKCAQKKKNNNKKNNNKKNNQGNRNSKPKVVGKRTGSLPPLGSDKPLIKGKRTGSLPSLSSKMPKNIQLKPYEPPAHIATLKQSLKTYKPKQIRSIRVVGRVQRSVQTRIDPESRLEQDYEGYSLDTSLGEVMLTVRALQRGGQVIDLAPYVGHRIRVTGDGYFKDDRARTGLRYEAVRRIETE